MPRSVSSPRAGSSTRSRKSVEVVRGVIGRLRLCSAAKPQAAGETPMPVSRRVLPGFSLTLGYSLFYLSLLVLLPLSACVLKAASLSPAEFWAAVSTPRALAAYRLTLAASLAAAILDAVLGFLVAWVLVRYEFPLRRLFDALVDLPFALPTAVAGLVYSSLYVPSGWLGRYLVPLGIQTYHSPLAIVLVLTFTGFPFVVRTVQPVLEALEPELEEAAATLEIGRASCRERG